MSLISKFKTTGTKKFLKEYYSSDGYFRIYKVKKTKWLKKFNLLISLMDVKPGERILDVGCATKIFKPYVERVKGIYFGLDIGEKFEPDFLCDAEEMASVKDNSFDWIVLSDILEHVPHPAKVLKESFRVGKKIIAVVPCLYRLEALPYLPRHRDDNHLIKMRPNKWLTMVEETGFSIELVRGFYYCPSIAFYPVLPLTVIDRIFRTKPFEIVGEKIEKVLAERPLGRYLGQELIIIGNRKQADLISHVQ